MSGAEWFGPVEKPCWNRCNSAAGTLKSMEPQSRQMRAAWQT